MLHPGADFEFMGRQCCTAMTAILLPYTVPRIAASQKKNKESIMKFIRQTIDAATANFTNTIGASELATVWTDPDFDAEQSAF